MMRLLVALALLVVMANCTTPNIELPATAECTVEVLEASDLPDVERQLHKSGHQQYPDERFLRLSFTAEEGSSSRLQLLYNLRGVQRQHSAGKLPSRLDSAEHHHYTAWLVQPSGGNQSDLRRSHPGLVSLCNGTANGTLPINGTHMGDLEPLADDAGSAHSVARRHRHYRISVRSVRSHWSQLDQFRRTVAGAGAGAASGAGAGAEEDAIPFEPVAWPTLQPLHRVRRQSFSRRARDFKYKPDARLQFERVNVSFNQQHKFLTKFGPYVIQLHVYLDPDLRKKLKDNRDEMVAVTKKVVSFANTLLRPFNTYALVSSLHLPFGIQYVHPSFSDDPLAYMQKEYIGKIYPAMNDEVIDCVFSFLGRGHMNYSVSDSKGGFCSGGKRPSCLGFVILEVDRPTAARMAGFALAHELAHQLGCQHDQDDQSKCECKFPACVMDQFVQAVDEAATVGWSDCSIRRLADALDRDAGLACLTPEQFAEGGETFATEVSADWGATCGNGIVEPGEACDCGGPRACRGNRCCRPDTCQLADGALCAVGNCCDLDKCAPRPAGSVCRPAEEPRCDFPESCDGASTVCPPDVSVSLDWPCAEGLLCRKRHCLQPRWGANYSGPGCPGNDSVPVNIGGCRPRPKLPPAELDGSLPAGVVGRNGMEADSDQAVRSQRPAGALVAAAALACGVWPVLLALTLS